MMKQYQSPVLEALFVRSERIMDDAELNILGSMEANDNTIGIKELGIV